MECSVCQIDVDTNKAWLSHLLEPFHQTKARNEIIRWNQPEKECALVAFCASPIIAFDELLSFFSRATYYLVTDFVWFENRPKMAFIRFESKEKVEKFLSSLAAPEIRVSNQLFQLKKAAECLQLEWQAMIPFPMDELQDNQADAHAQVVPGVSSNVTNGLLVKHYKQLCEDIEIRDEDYKKGLDFLHTLRIVFNKNFPDCQLIWFRNWYLKLKNTSSCDPLIFLLDQQGTYAKLANDSNFRMPRKAKSTFPALKKAQITAAFSSSSLTDELGIREITNRSPEDVSECHSYNFSCQKNDIIFNMAMSPTHMLPEIQACRLISYFCTFDSRVKPLLTVIRYWAKTNNIRLGNLAQNPIKLVPDPAALDWLVMFFLCYEKKILPTPREIMKRPHIKIGFLQLDIGFSEDATFAQQFSSRYQETDEEVHAFNIFTLAQEFFYFYSIQLDLGKGAKVVFNTMDGELISMTAFLGDIDAIPTKLIMHERKIAREENTVRNKNKDAAGLILLHPLHLRHGFSFDDRNFVTSICPAMRTTGMKLKEGLDLYKNGIKFEIRSTFEI